MNTSIKAVESRELNDIVGRIWDRDYTLWSDSPTEITDRLGWLDVADEMRAEVAALYCLARQIRDEGTRHIVLLGMGGSSLGAEVLRQCLGAREGWPELVVLDSTLPDQVTRTVDSIDLEHSLFVVSSKSGTTTEPRLLYKLFREELGKLGYDGERFIVVTDPGSPLEQLAKRHGFRKTFLNPPEICGRYSVLSYFGLVPAALAGYDAARILDSGIRMSNVCGPHIPAHANPGALMGVSVASLAASGRDKLTILTSPTLDSFGLWAEQLVAESLGKCGKGIVPVTNEPIVDIGSYGPDRQFVYLKLSGEDSEIDCLATELSHAGHPIIQYELEDISALGGEFYRWGFAVATAAALIGVNPFDQPDVESAKILTKQALESTESHTITPMTTPGNSLTQLVSEMKTGDYLAILAYVPQTPEHDAALTRLRSSILEKYQIPTTLGYGPRYLHSTGQLHKGGPNNVAVLMIVSPHENDIAIPGEDFTFGALSNAQAAADLRVLKDAGRPTACIEFRDVLSGSIRL